MPEFCPNCKSIMFPPTYLFCWNNVPGKDIEILKKYLEKMYSVNWVKAKYLFSWEEVPGNDNLRLIDFLKQNYDLDWVKPDNIDKFDDGKTIRITAEEKSLSLSLNNKKSDVILKINDVKVDNFVAKTENGKLNVYRAVKIRKIDSCGTISVTAEKNSITLNLNNDKTEVHVKISDSRTDKLIVKNEGGKLNIYPSENGNKIVCRKCGFERDIDKGKAEISITPIKDRGEIPIFEGPRVMVDASIVGAECPNCSNGKAYAWLHDVRGRGDEPPCTIYQCTKCGNRWRSEYLV